MAHSPKYIDKRKKTLSKDVIPQRMSYIKKKLYMNHIYLSIKVMTAEGSYNA